MPIAAITLAFDPILRLGDVAVRWQTVALVAVVFAGLVLAGLIARRNGLRPDDLLFIAVAAVPGAVVGGRLGYVLLHLDYYGSNKVAILDPAQGSLELALAVVGGVASGTYVATLLGAPVGAWLKAAAPSVLFVLGASKLAMLLGGAGQGQPADAPWAIAFTGPGPWASLAPDVPSHPSQAYEGIFTLALLALLTAAAMAGAFRRDDAQPFLVALAGWGLTRAAASTTWRDPTVAGPLGMGGLIALVVAAGAVAGWLLVARRSGRVPADGTMRDVEWADPAARPRF